ncbi:MAG: phosphatidylserine decarboxylase [Victivallales bacterium]|jgi:phosphatidylserine decarboxylase|nr:phosphatidylserine decarboxylase [Victivallales bacterium]
MTLTRYGIREWGSALIFTVILLVGCYFLYRGGYPGWAGGIGIAAIVIFFAFAAFFRNPRRSIPNDSDWLISPADGVVRDIGEVDDFNFPPFEGRAVRIGIFLSVLNVHVNRASADFVVESKFYREGKFLDARHPECATVNEAMTIAGTASANGKHFPMAIRQISGKLARKIVCPVNPGRHLKRGEIYGMIKFGSRTELYLPVDEFEIKVKIGETVRGGETVMAIAKDSRSGK